MFWQKFKYLTCGCHKPVISPSNPIQLDSLPVCPAMHPPTSTHSALALSVCECEFFFNKAKLIRC